MLNLKSHTLLILITPLVGIIFGAIIAYHHEISVIAFSFNLIGVALGILLALLFGIMPLQRHLLIFSSLALGLMAASLWSLDILGVHRWIVIGSAYINISMVLAPLILYAICISLRDHQIYPLVLTMGVSITHSLQPDAGQACAFGSASITIFLRHRNVSYLVRSIGIIVSVLGISFAWYQPDPLPPVEHVEHILHLARGLGSVGLVGIVLSILFLLAPIIYAFRQDTHDDSKVLALAFIVYLIAAYGVTEVGNYPVPIIGAGASSILGYYVIIGLVVMPNVIKTHNYIEYVTK